jgi:hypothetical protein
MLFRGLMEALSDGQPSRKCPCVQPASAVFLGSRAGIRSSAMTRKKRFKQLEQDIEAVFLFIVVGVLIFVLLAAVIIERWFR